MYNIFIPTSLRVNKIIGKKCSLIYDIINQTTLGKSLSIPNICISVYKIYYLKFFIFHLSSKRKQLKSSHYQISSGT